MKREPRLAVVNFSVRRALNNRIFGKYIELGHLEVFCVFLAYEHSRKEKIKRKHANLLVSYTREPRFTRMKIAQIDSILQTFSIFIPLILKIYINEHQ